MAKTAQEIADDIAKLKGGTHPLRPLNVPVKTGEKLTPGQTEKSEKKQRGKNGGKRPGSGRKPLAQDEGRKSMKKAWEDFANEEVEVVEIDKGTREQRKLKMSRLRVSQEALFKQVKTGDVGAIKEFNDRTGGKARQPLTGGDEDDTPLRIQSVDVPALGAKIYGLEDDDDNA